MWSVEVINQWIEILSVYKQATSSLFKAHKHALNSSLVNVENVSTKMKATQVAII